MHDWRAFVDSARRSPANVRFNDPCRLVERCGFTLDRQRGSHLIYRHAVRRDVPLVNLQKGSGGKAKPYQVRQVLDLVETYGLEVRA
jgi:hypothetical protein